MRGDPGHLAQVVLHLLANANAASLDRPGSRVRVATRVEGGEAIVEVRDEGKGIPPEHLARIFEPFFTTKEVGKGTGLGLATVHGIVSQHAGFVDVDPGPGRGAGGPLSSRRRGAPRG